MFPWSALKAERKKENGRSQYGKISITTESE